MRVGRPVASVLKADVQMSNLTISFGGVEVVQVLTCPITLWVETEPSVEATEFSPPDMGSFKILKIFSKDQIRFRDDRGSVVCKVFAKCDLSQILSDEVLTTLDTYVEQQLRSGDKFTKLDYKVATKFTAVQKQLMRRL